MISVKQSNQKQAEQGGKNRTMIHLPVITEAVFYEFYAFLDQLNLY